MITVAIIDDHPIFRDGLRAVLATLDDVETFWEAGTAAEALRLAQQAPPDVVFMDLHLPGTSGIEATRQLTAGAGSRVVVGGHEILPVDGQQTSPVVDSRSPH
jgi:DNA-binding NarL/FixJ family response regulator